MEFRIDLVLNNGPRMEVGTWKPTDEEAKAMESYCFLGYQTPPFIQNLGPNQATVQMVRIH